MKETEEVRHRPVYRSHLEAICLLDASRHHFLDVKICCCWLIPKGCLALRVLDHNLTREQADYCISHMKPYMDSKGRELPSAYDYIEFTRSLFVN